MAQPPQQDKRVLLGANRTNQGAEVFEHVISRHRETYQWAQQHRYSMERQCLLHIVIRTLKNLEGLQFLEKRHEEEDVSANSGVHMDTRHSPREEQGSTVWSKQLTGETWVPASEVRIRQAVIESLEKGVQHQPTHRQL